MPQADILTPNQFELEWLSGQPCSTAAQAREAAHTLRARMRAQGPRIVLVSSLRTAETPADALDMLLCCEQGAFCLRAPLLPGHFSGAGDTLSALFLFGVLQSGEIVIAAERAASSMAGLLRRTWLAGSAELLTIAAQEEFIAPSAAITAAPC